MSLVIILVILITLWLLIEILSVVFKMTGLDLYKSRFQIISIITHTGFTTSESELIAQHPLRRRIASILMVVSYVTQVTLISLFVKILIDNQNRLIYSAILLLVITIFVVVLIRNRYISTKFNRLVERVLSKKIIDQNKTSIDQILKISPGYGVYEFIIDENNPYCSISLGDAKLSTLQVHVLKVERGSKTYDFPDANFILSEGDRLILYGKTESVTKIALAKNNVA